MSEGRFDLSTFRSERTNEASTLTITPKRSSSRDVGTSSYRYHTATVSCNLHILLQDECDNSIGEVVRYHYSEATFRNPNPSCTGNQKLSGFKDGHRFFSPWLLWRPFPVFRHTQNAPVLCFLPDYPYGE
ncbi:hypothetical protein TNCV_1166021 [Trichonephila clavipes]|uniref:Uncharacterized protein n=1 Tax=Trichonephila clavipes TaxID=2585209 RepID=A0A8X6VPD4_TRICX|nr:hypothetical protein TNCV_1166021 [Trichonephila clavipes]